MEIRQLVTEAIGGKSKSIRALIDLGSETLPNLFESMDLLKEKQDVSELASVIRYMRDSKSVSILIDRLNSRSRNDIHVDTAIYDALVNFSSLRDAQQALILEINNPIIPFYQKKYLVESLGNSQHFDFSDEIINMFKNLPFEPIDSETLLVLLKREEDDGESYDLTLLLLYACEALLKKGITKWCWIPEELCTYYPTSDIDLRMILRKKSVDCFNHYVSKTSYQSLVKCLNDPYFEIRQEACKALYLIGTPHIVRDLIKLIQDDDFITANNAMIYVETILGDSPFSQFEPTEINFQDFENWCEEKISSLSETSVYRNGEKFDLHEQINKLNNKDLRKLAFEDIKLYTGQVFNYEDFTPIDNQYLLFKSALEWFNDNSNTFERGVLYRRGKKIDLSFFTDEK